MNLLYIFLLSFIISASATIAIKLTAQKLNIVDRPDKNRKIHKEAIPLLGGMAIFFSFFIMLFVMRGDILARGLSTTHILSFFIGALIIVIGGFIDDKYNISPQWQIIFPILASVAAIAGGIGIVKITNPAGGLLYFGGALGIILTFLWLMGMMYTTKLLDGVDGLVSGLGVISGIIIFLFTMTTKYYQPDVGLMGLIFAAVAFGFLLFNSYPAKIFLGEGGSLLVGYIIAVLAIISGGKIAIALLIMGIPIMDVAWIIIRRLWQKKNPFKFADRKHLHHRFLDMGLSQRQTVFIYYVLAAIFGSTALFLQSHGKMIALGILAIVMVLLVFLSIFLPNYKIKS
ncbi:MAG: MraY family glycosyltransferase [Patescibacteria group bacterium]|jgi:UDP-GlcNAc:undecaprenyl-phosphate GlcNAc-1-phosphate transferase